MDIFIVTRNIFKAEELLKYFKDVGLPATVVDSTKSIRKYVGLTEYSYFAIREVSTLHNPDGTVLTTEDFGTFREATHTSILSVTSHVVKDGKVDSNNEVYSAKVEGYIFPHLRDRKVANVFGWDDIFVPKSTNRPYHYMKENGIKNSARDIAFGRFMEDYNKLFMFPEKVKTNHLIAKTDDVVSFDPIIYRLVTENKYLRKAYERNIFRNLLNNVMNSGVFVRSASTRPQRNYWLPGLNAGIPLTPKRDEIHEAVFLFHDIMHFAFPDLLVTGNTVDDRKKYIISRMVSEAMSLVLADMIFVNILVEDDDIEDYDWAKRKIWPVYKAILKNHSDRYAPVSELCQTVIKANVEFALLGDSSALNRLTGGVAEVMEAYVGKYERFFIEDYVWTNENCNTMMNNLEVGQYVSKLADDLSIFVPTTTNSFPDVSTKSYVELVRGITDSMCQSLSFIINNHTDYYVDLATSNAAKRYFIGQMNIFAKYETSYNDLFEGLMFKLLQKHILDHKDIGYIRSIYNEYINRLVVDGFILFYTGERYKEICPLFSPFYVFYERKETAYVDIPMVVDNIFRDTGLDVRAELFQSKPGLEQLFF